jgi:predicted TIM-barrel fold metal-dependent hydrolase
MKTNFTFLKLSVLFFTVSLSAQQQATPEKQSEKNPDKFKQMYDLLATPNMYRTASGAPGPEYYQQQADYKMDIELDDKNTKLYGKETVIYGFNWIKINNLESHFHL